MNAQSLLPYLWILLLLVVWELYWKGKALWRAAKQNQLYWFIVILIINSAGILPLLYLYIFSRKTS